MKIQIGVGGRFNSPSLFKALWRAGHEVTLCTTLPASRFDAIPHERIVSLVQYEIVLRLLSKIGAPDLGDHLKMLGFGRHLSRITKRSSPDVVIGWSGFVKEAMIAAPKALKILVRESCHIDFQNRILKEEYEKFGLSVPSRPFVAEREHAEYQLADYILVPSDFARRTYVDEGIAPAKVKRIWTGLESSHFSASDKPAPQPLNVVNFGSQSIRKGILYLLEATKTYSASEVQVHLIGDIDPSLKPLLKKYESVKLYPACSRDEINRLLKDMHVFVLPTLEDGFGVVLGQAMAAGLVPISTTHAGASELIVDGTTGFVVPPRSPEAIRTKLERLRQPAQLESMRKAVLATPVRSAREFEDEFADWFNVLTTASVPAGRTPARSSSR